MNSILDLSEFRKKKYLRLVPEKPLIHFAHANGFPAGTYQLLFRYLSDSCRVEAIDMLGHNPHFPIGRNWKGLAEELIAYLENCGEPVIGIGHSLGGVVSFIAAWRRPDLFRMLIMLDPPLIYGYHALLFGLFKTLGMAGRFTPARRSAGRRAEWPGREIAYQYFRKKKLFKNTDPQCLKDYVEHGTEDFEGGIRLRYRVDKEVAIFNTAPSDLWRYRRPLQVPAVLIYGEQSDVSRDEFMKPFCQRHQIKRISAPGGHLFPIEKPRETARIIKEVIHQLSAAKT